jgi:rod shape-determining protein MreD
MSPAVRIPPIMVLALVLHTAVFPQLRLWDVAADVLLLSAIAGGMAGGPDRGAVIGFTSGIIADCFLRTPFGLAALTYLIIGWAIGMFQTTVLHARWWIPVLTGFTASVAGVALFTLLGAVVGQSQLLSGRLVTIALVVGALNALLCPLAVRIFRWGYAGVPRPGLVLP